MGMREVRLVHRSDSLARLAMEAKNKAPPYTDLDVHKRTAWQRPEGSFRQRKERERADLLVS